MKTLLFAVLILCCRASFAQIKIDTLPVSLLHWKNYTLPMDVDTIPVKLEPYNVPQSFFDILNDSDISMLQNKDTGLAHLTKEQCLDLCYLRKLKNFCKTEDRLKQLALQKCVELWYDRERKFGNKPTIAYIFTKANLKELVEQAIKEMTDEIIQQQ